MRLASQHSWAATDAYLRRDHLSAQQFSMKARAEWMAAKGLNAKERLHNLESLVLLEQSVSPDRNRKGAGIVRCASLESLGCMEMEKLDEQQASSQQRPTSLRVITGIMLHLAHVPIDIHM
ncbi:hypothetical protein LOK49_LG15G00823 [Camellia lanceoleosa]|uniref:Uncharacterized protein n=1 Tax=Camellia lanceoleosa TaxID=1840588 RepID=A0ACC0FAM7_9ERIC|nr:hypothetical protein LOK49_LG15G00823 [Camellia lanceoleosa]